MHPGLNRERGVLWELGLFRSFAVCWVVMRVCGGGGKRVDRKTLVCPPQHAAASGADVRTTVANTGDDKK